MIEHYLKDERLNARLSIQLNFSGRLQGVFVVESSHPVWGHLIKAEGDTLDEILSAINERLQAMEFFQ